MIDAGNILLGGVLPAVVAAIAMLSGWKLARHAGVAWLVGLSMGYLAGHWAIDARGVGVAAAVARSFNPHEARDWLPLAVVSAATIEAIALLGKKGAVLAWMLRVVWCLLLPWRLLAGSVYLPSMVQNVDLDMGNFATGAWETGAWSTLEAVAWLSGASGLLALVWIALRRVPEQTLPRWRSSLATFVTLGATATITLSGSLTIGQLMGVLVAVLVGCGGVAAALRLESGPESAAGPLLAAYGGALVIARFLFDPELPLSYAALLLLALIAAVGWIPFLTRLSIRVHALVRIALCVTASALTAIPAAQDFTAAQAQSGPQSSPRTRESSAPSYYRNTSATK